MEFGAVVGIHEKPDLAMFDKHIDHGYTCFEIGARSPYIEHDIPDETKRLRDHLAERGCRVNSIHAGYKMQFAVSAEDPAVRDETIRQSAKAAKLCVELGGDIIVVHPGGPVKEVADMDAYIERVFADIGRQAQAIIDEGARPAIENANPNGFPDHPDMLMRIVNMFPADKVGVCIDTGHANFSGHGTDVIRAASGRIITTHIHDNMGGFDDHQVPGVGTVDWDAYMRAFAEAGYAGPWLFETGRAGDAVFTKAEEAQAVLRTAWGKVVIQA
jgi:sugar phosphate isomerase/epimerase